MPPRRDGAEPLTGDQVGTEVGDEGEFDEEYVDEEYVDDEYDDEDGVDEDGVEGGVPDEGDHEDEVDGDCRELSDVRYELGCGDETGRTGAAEGCGV